ncbi:hypothetical protein GDO81_011805 [Engystomops pustulosus]|uniref:Secreted protein n=1 Tax=Engystomops pustulosus TaxID=76066 RepID=A0AAV7BHG4_ENGPU|nr:hypothetical protein GDO81_011805 [Engystomops pustulosus]
MKHPALLGVIWFQFSHQTLLYKTPITGALCPNLTTHVTRGIDPPGDRHRVTGSFCSLISQCPGRIYFSLIAFLYYVYINSSLP